MFLKKSQFIGKRFVINFWVYWKFTYNSKKVNLNIKTMKNVVKIILSLLLGMSFMFSVNAGFFSDMFDDETTVEYNCWDGWCGLETGINLAKTGLNELETERSFSEYIQAITVYLLSFVTLIAILYVIYAGFRILTWNGNEEKLKSSKSTIVYVALGILLMWLAVPIVKWIIDVIGVGA